MRQNHQIVSIFLFSAHYLIVFKFVQLYITSLLFFLFVFVLFFVLVWRLLLLCKCQPGFYYYFLVYFEIVSSVLLLFSSFGPSL
jgi:hypothetical protein